MFHHLKVLVKDSKISYANDCLKASATGIVLVGIVILIVTNID